MNIATTTKLSLKRVAIDTYHENVAYLNRRCEAYRAEGFQALSKVEIRLDGKRILAVLNIVDDDTIVTPGEVGLSEQIFQQFAVQEGQEVGLSHASPPNSMHYVRLKMKGQRLDQAQLTSIVQDIADNRYSKTEIAAFLVSSADAGLDRDEILSLTRAMIESGHRLDWEEPMVVDKHCIGGIPGNRTTMIVVPIVAAHGLLFPKTSSRAITSPAGTADTMEVLATVDLEPNALHSIVHTHRGCLAWGGKAKLAPVDDILISVERPLEIDSPGQMIASILSKKIACGASHLLLDIPIGATAKVTTASEAMKLRKLFEYVGDQLGLDLQVVITDGSQPIGRGIGPVLEARDVMQVLTNAPEAPRDLREKSLKLAGLILELDPDIRGGKGYDIARDILESGRALSKFNAIIDAQGRREESLTPGKLTFDVKATSRGVVTEIDNFCLAKIARLAGAPIDKGAGVDLFKKVGDSVEIDEVMYRIHAEFQADFGFAVNWAEQNNGFVISAERRHADFIF